MDTEVHAALRAADLPDRAGAESFISVVGAAYDAVAPDGADWSGLREKLAADASASGWSPEAAQLIDVLDGQSDPVGTVERMRQLRTELAALFEQECADAPAEPLDSAGRAADAELEAAVQPFLDGVTLGDYLCNVAGVNLPEIVGLIDQVCADGPAAGRAS